MLIGSNFARIFETTHGQLLVYVENQTHSVATLHQVMSFDGHDWSTYDKKVRGTPEEVRTAFDAYGTNESEAVALVISKAVETGFCNAPPPVIEAREYQNESLGSDAISFIEAPQRWQDGFHSSEAGHD